MTPSLDAWMPLEVEVVVRCVNCILGVRTCLYQTFCRPFYSVINSSTTRLGSFVCQAPLALGLRRLRPSKGLLHAPEASLWFCLWFCFLHQAGILRASRLLHAQAENAESTAASVQSATAKCCHTRCISEPLPVERFSNEFVVCLSARDQGLTSINASPMYWRASLEGILWRWKTPRARCRVASMRQRARFTTSIRSAKGCDAVSRMTKPRRRTA